MPTTTQSASHPTMLTPSKAFALANSTSSKSAATAAATAAAKLTKSRLLRLLRRWVLRPALVWVVYRAVVLPLLRRIWARLRFGRWTRPSAWLHCSIANREEFTRNVPAAAAYRPTPWLWGGALQTISPEVFPERWRAGPRLEAYAERTSIEIPRHPKVGSACWCQGSWSWSRSWSWSSIKSCPRTTNKHSSRTNIHYGHTFMTDIHTYIHPYRYMRHNRSSRRVQPVVPRSFRRGR